MKTNTSQRLQLNVAMSSRLARRSQWPQSKSSPLLRRDIRSVCQSLPHLGSVPGSAHSASIASASSGLRFSPSQS